MLDQIDLQLPDDLRIPADLRSFWTNWNPSTFGMVLGDGLPTVERSLTEWQASKLPSILLLVCSMDRQSIYIEMQSDTHPGTRLYFADSEDRVLRLWGIGIADLLDMVGKAYVMTGADPNGPYHAWVDTGILHQVAEEMGEGILTEIAEHRVNLSLPSTWPTHWQLANGEATAAR